MPRYSEQTITRIREVARLEDIVAHKVHLTRCGADWKGCCPFHEEKTASFHVYQDGHYHCFGCGAHGNVFDFVMQTEGLTFVESIEQLAAEYHLPLEDERTTSRKKNSDEQYHANRFEDALRESEEAQVARDYLTQRGISTDTQSTFHLGYAHSRAVEYHKGEKCPSPFRNRLIIPLHNRYGEIVGMAGRILTGDSSGVKYINSADTTTFKKGSMLYGMHLLQRASKDQQRILLMEGYFDVITLYQYGLRNLVASMGTALTEQQATLLAETNMPVTILYDGDKAGQKATERAIPILLKAGLLPKVIVLPAEHDPDSYIRQYGVLPREESFLDYLLRTMPDAVRQPHEIVDFAHKILDILQLIPDTIAQQVFIRAMEMRMGISVS